MREKIYPPDDIEWELGTTEEGGRWREIELMRDISQAHSLKARDGRVWDEFNGWRQVR